MTVTSPRETAGWFSENGDQISSLESELKVESSAPLAVPVARRGTLKWTPFLWVLLAVVAEGDEAEAGEFGCGEATNVAGDQAKVAVRGREA